MSKKIALCLLLAVSALLAGAAPENPFITKVKTGLLADYKTTTIGKAFEGSFKNFKWTTEETTKGVRVVDFKGELEPTDSEGLQMREVYCGGTMTIHFRFAFDLNEESFKMTDADVCVVHIDVQSMTYRQNVVFKAFLDGIYR